MFEAVGRTCIGLEERQRQPAKLGSGSAVAEDFVEDPAGGGGLLSADFVTQDLHQASQLNLAQAGVEPDSEVGPQL